MIFQAIQTINEFTTEINETGLHVFFLYVANIIPIFIAVGVLSMIIIFGKRRLIGERL